MTDTQITFSDALFNSSSNIFYIVYQFLPRLLAAILIFLVGLLISNWIKRLVVKILESINLSNLAKKTSLEQFIQKAEIKTKIEDIIGTLFKWIIILIFTVSSINLLGLSTISAVLNNFLSYLPRIISAIFILALGVLLAGIVESLVKGAVAQIDTKVGRLLGKISSYLIVIFASMAALNELGIAKDLINILFVGIVAMLSIGFGLALGLGAKDIVAKILDDWYKKLKS